MSLPDKVEESLDALDPLIALDKDEDDDEEEEEEEEELEEKELEEETIGDLAALADTLHEAGSLSNPSISRNMEWIDLCFMVLYTGVLTFLGWYFLLYADSWPASILIQ